jgi:hypothetical protein
MVKLKVLPIFNIHYFLSLGDIASSPLLFIIFYPRFEHQIIIILFGEIYFIKGENNY